MLSCSFLNDDARREEENKEGNREATGLGEKKEEEERLESLTSLIVSLIIHHQEALDLHMMGVLIISPPRASTVLNAVTSCTHTLPLPNDDDAPTNSTRTRTEIGHGRCKTTSRIIEEEWDDLSDCELARPTHTQENNNVKKPQQERSWFLTSR